METNYKLMDLHNHTIWSDGVNSTRELIEDAIGKNIKILGFTDHFNTSKCHSISPEHLNLYTKEIENLKEEYKYKISILTGVEINCIPFPSSFESLSFSQLDNLDFVLIENLGQLSDKIGLKDLEDYLKNFNCKVGFAHTDLFRIGARHKNEGGIDCVIDFMKKYHIFWEINANFAYDCFDDIIYQQNKKEVQELIKKLICNNIEITVGSDKHSLEDFELSRFVKANELAYYISS